MVELLPLAMADAGAVEALLDAAFGDDRHGRTAYRLREGVAAIPALSFAAFDDAILLGTIQCWPVAHVDDSGKTKPLVMVGPVAVLPAVQREGLGHRLMATMLAVAADQADGALMMIGDPEYYERFFGFSVAATGAWDLPGPYEKHRLLARAINGHGVPTGPGMIGPR